MAAKQAEIKKQVEYYLSDKNLAQDKFFNEKASAEGGWIDVKDILNCNKIKQMKATADSIVAALKNSTEVEVDAAGKRVRRSGGKAAPALAAGAGSKKRDSKAQSKEEGKKEESKEEAAAEEALPAVDDRGNPILCNADFENPVIVHFKTEDNKDPAFKVNWKDVEAAVKKDFPRVKIVYSRND